MSGKKLYVGNLPYDIDDSELKLAFAQCGRVEEARLAYNRSTGGSLGFGFVTMRTAEEAAAAITRWDGAPYAGRPLRVNEARERERR